LASHALGFSFLFVVDTLMKFSSPPYLAVALHLDYHFARSESFSLGSRSGLRCRNLGRTRPRLAGLVPLVGKASVSNIMVPVGLVVFPNPLLWPICRVWLARSRSFLPPSPGSVCSYRTTPILSLAGTLLLITGWHPTAPRWLASPLPGGSARLAFLPDRCTPPRLRPVVVLHCLGGGRQRLGATLVITGAAIAFRFGVGPLFQGLSFMRDHHPLHLSPNGP